MNTVNLNTFVPQHVHQRFVKTLPQFQPRQKIIVIGAGSFGGWTALHLLRKGFKVTLIDAWGPGNSRSSSGDETRVIRSTYGANNFYFDLNVRALELWKENEILFHKKLFYNTGVLWFCYTEQTLLVDDSIPFAQAHKMEYEYLTINQIRKRFPIVNVEDLHHAYYDPFGGHIKARESCKVVQENFLKEGGEYIQSYIKPGEIQSGRLANVVLSNGDTIRGDAFIFACGSFLNKVFPDLLVNEVTSTKQEVYYFGLPEVDSHLYDQFPAWIDADGKDFYYGIADNGGRGFKIGVDKRGVLFDPLLGDRAIDQHVYTAARKFLNHRFPGLKTSPLLENRVCPYENSTDGNFIFDLHPETDNAFILGGGSGHGFKHGPAFGELVSDILTGLKPLPDCLRLKTTVK